MTISWKQLLTEAESLTKTNGKNAWRTAQIVRDLFKSGDFLEEACGGKLDDRDSKLSKYSGRFALGLNDLIQMIEHFPDQKDWESGRLDILRDKTCTLLSSRAPRGKHPRKMVTTDQYEALKRKFRELQIKYDALQEEVKTLRRLVNRRDPANA